jgi:peroxiredoxin
MREIIYLRTLRIHSTLKEDPMEVRKGAFALLLVTTVIISACGASKPTPEAVMDKETPTAEAMMETESPTAEPMMGEETPTAEAMMGEEMSPTEAMTETGSAMAEPMMGEETPTPEAMMSTDWFNAELTDVNTGESFKVADFHGKVVLVETMAVWCPTCFTQQKEVQTLHELLGMRDDLVSLGLDIDPNETADILKAYTNKNGFDWLYAVAPAEVAREIGHLYGDQFLNPPSAPMLIIDRQGQVHPLPFGVKSAQALQEALGPYLNP